MEGGVLEGMGGDLVEVDDGVQTVSAGDYDGEEQGSGGEGKMGRGGDYCEPARSMSWRIMER